MKMAAQTQAPGGGGAWHGGMVTRLLGGWHGATAPPLTCYPLPCGRLQESGVDKGVVLAQVCCHLDQLCSWLHRFNHCLQEGTCRVDSHTTGAPVVFLTKLHEGRLVDRCQPTICYPDRCTRAAKTLPAFSLFTLYVPQLRASPQTAAQTTFGITCPALSHH